jgi:hypothetical protein
MVTDRQVSVTRVPLQWDTYTWDELLTAHKYYADAPYNADAYKFCKQIEHVLATRACASADAAIERSGLANEHKT